MKTITLNKDRDVTLTPYLVTKEIRPAFLICPGGGYTNCDESEGKPVAKAFNDRGYNAFILRYSVADHRAWPNPLQDFDCAMEYLANHAKELSIDPGKIVVAGFSAGGHVAACAASAAKNKPFASILCYGLTARETLDYCNENAPDASELVDENTCPCFLASSRNDWIVPIFNTHRFIAALERHDIDYEAHIYGYALHGFSVGEATGAVGPLFCGRVGNWVSDSIQWVEELVSGRYLSIREKAEYNDAHGTVLSTMNSCKVFAASEKAVKLFKRKFPAQYLIYTMACKQFGPFMDTISLRQLFQLMKVSPKTIAKMDEALSVFEFKR